MSINIEIPGARYIGAADSLRRAKYEQDLEPRQYLRTPLRTTDVVDRPSDIDRLIGETYVVFQKPFYKRAENLAGVMTPERLEKLIMDPVSGDRLDLAHSFDALVVYSDSQRSSVKRKLEGLKYQMHNIHEKLTDSSGPLDLETQLSAVNDDPDRLILDTYSLALYWREISRGRDEAVGMKEVDEKERLQMLRRLPTFPVVHFRRPLDEERQLGWTGGDYYHGLTTEALTAQNELIKKHKQLNGCFNMVERAKHTSLDFVCRNTARIASLRDPNDYPYGLHPYADKVGHETGVRVAQIITREL